MRLSKVTYSGFKSFADATVFASTANLVGIVGPNGCGKSNIIDGIRWVLGEGSVKNLRGTSMEDVIFAGTDLRAPAERASVELLFDNSEKKIRGPMAAYQEIAVKRELIRSGESHYFLNNKRCRKKDITDLLLGTGLGSRSYAIIQQGMVSKIIESKPEEIRFFLEEAAGISRFKERKREAQSKIALTNDKLDRLTDIRNSLQSQLQKLTRQSKQALRFTKLQQERKVKQHQLYTVQLEHAQQTRDQQHQAVQDIKQALEQDNKSIAALDREIKQARTQLNDHRQKYQSCVSDQRVEEHKIKQLEEQNTATQQQLERAQKELQQSKEQHKTLTTRLAEEQNKRQQQEAKIDASGSILHTATQQLATVKQKSEVAASHHRQWQEKYDAHVATEKTNRHLTHMSQEQLTTAQTALDANQKKLAQLEQELAQLNTQDQESQSLHFEDEVALNQQSLVVQQKKYDQCQAENTTLLQKRKALQETLTQLQKKEHTLTTTISTLNALLMTGNQDDRANALDWIAERGFDQAHVLSSSISAEEPWASAVEYILAKKLHSLVVEQKKDVYQALENAPPGEVVFTVAGTKQETRKADNRLSNFVRAPSFIADYLSTIHIAESLQQAATLIETLPPHESVVTADGIWIEHDTVYAFHHNLQSNEGPLQRAKEKEDAEHQREAITKEMTKTQSQLTNIEDAIEKNSKASEEASKATQALFIKIDQIKKQQSQLTQSVTEARMTRQSLTNACAECSNLIQQHTQEKETATKKIAALQKEATTTTKAITAMEAEQDALTQAVQDTRAEYEKRIKEHARITSSQEAEQTLLAKITEYSKHLQEQIAHLEQRIEQLTQQHQTLTATLPTLQEQISQNTKQAQKKEATLATLEKQQQSAQQALEALENKQQTLTNKREALRDSLEPKQLNLHETQINIKQLQESLAQLDLPQQDREPTEDSDETLTEAIETIDRKIKQLGDINMVAMKEQEDLANKKTLLDTQCQDVADALDKLEKTINAINQETEQAFQAVFQSVSTNLNDLVIKLFQGGSAKLQLQEGNDNPGVNILVQPPGKKVTNIHLLSGGEKSMTAIAFVVAMFKLNPAPFCLMDEVDAALDDVNVERFCELLTTMSDTVQHIIITHHKTTMAAVEQLHGITMTEAGISRIVGVDIKQAREMVLA